jgi:hypothetical protein
VQVAIRGEGTEDDAEAEAKCETDDDGHDRSC